MGANIELTAYCKKIIQLSEVVRALSEMNYNVELIEAELIDDWFYNNHQKFSHTFDWQDIYNSILDNKIFISRLKVNSQYNLGYIATMTEDGTFDISLWLDTDRLQYLDDVINKSNRGFYDTLTYKIIDILKDNSLILLGIGVETAIEYTNDIVAIVKNSSSILRWIVPSNTSLEIHDYNFEIQQVGNFNVYSLIY